jgi:hypothetical protein
VPSWVDKHLIAENITPEETGRLVVEIMDRIPEVLDAGGKARGRVGIEELASQRLPLYGNAVGSGAARPLLNLPHHHHVLSA